MDAQAIREMNRCGYAREMRTQQRTALCWLLRDRRWHLADHHLCEQFAACVNGDSEAVAAMLRYCVPGSDWGRVKAEGRVLVFKATLATMARNGLCRAREVRGKQQVRLVKLTRESRRRLAAMEVLDAKARAVAETRLTSKPRPTAEQLKQELWALSYDGVDPRGRNLVVLQVAGWYAREVSRPDPAEDLFWLKAGFFSPQRLFYFRPEGVNLPTQMAAKALTVEVLAGRLGMPPDHVLHADDADLGSWAYRTLRNTVSASLGSSLATALWDLARQQVTDPSRVDDQVAAVVKQTDWLWVARRLRDELRRHAHRRGFRALELACAMPYEHVEARLGDFLGTPEETFLKATDRP